MRDLKPSDLAGMLNLSRSQVARRAAEIPGHRMTKGGHHRFRDCPHLWEWIMKNKKTEEWNRLTGPLEELPCKYDDAYLKTIGPMGAIAFMRAVTELTDKLMDKKKWLEAYYTKKLRSRRR
jgi:hypothetical protein